MSAQRELGQALANKRPELEAVAAEAACHDQAGVLIPLVEDEVAIR